MDEVANTILENIRAAGFVVSVGALGGMFVVRSIYRKTGEVRIVRGKDYYDVVCELAQQCGIQIEE